MTVTYQVIIFLTIFATFSNGYKYFQTKIPNGDNVNHPCLLNRIWKGVGHFNQKGGGARNPFGVDFKKAGNEWTRDLCMKDSDGDGKSNGEELGDPTCTWSIGKIPTRTTGITHPGVCEPITTLNCRTRNKDWDICLTDKFVCNATKEPNVTTIDVRMDYTNVPDKVTNYFCQAFALPNATDLHLIASEPIINNTNVMHHILLFGCTSKPSSKHFSPYECGMGGTSCTTIIDGWTLGSSGECFREHSGVRIGLRSFKYLVMQVHWNNPERRKDQMDSSGMRLYVTTNLRGNDSSTLTVGQLYLSIPPGKSTFLEEADCSTNCTSRKLPHPVYLLNVRPHMHNAGRFSEINLYRGGKLHRVLLKYSEVRYDDPQRIDFFPPVEFKPGDRLHVKCVYKTINEKHALYYGDATDDEMCYGFFRYYPAQTKLTSCLNYGPIDLCTVHDAENGGGGYFGLPGRVGNCSNLSTFLYATLPNVWLPKITEFCDSSKDVCHHKCKALVVQMNKDPCYQGWSKKYMHYISQYVASLQTVRYLVSRCEFELEKEASLQLLESKTTRKPEMEHNHDHSNHKSSSNLSSTDKTILIVVGSVTVALLLITVVAVALYRAFTLSPKSKVTKPNIYATQVDATPSDPNAGFVNNAFNEKTDF